MGKPLIHRSPMPGLGLSMGITLTMLSLVVLLPIGALLLKGASFGPLNVWDTVNRDRVWAALFLSFRLSFYAALFNLVFGVILAWVLVRYQFPGRRIMFGALLFTLTVPGLVLLIPQFVLARNLGLLNSLWGLVIVYAVLNLGLNTFLLRGFFAAMPAEIFDAPRLERTREFLSHPGWSG